MSAKRKILITGAAGYIGSFLRKAWRGRYDMVLTDIGEIQDPGGARTIQADIQDIDAMKQACKGIDTVVHLAANPSYNAEFAADVLPKNIIGTHNVLEAAVQSGVKRVIVASSIHCVGGYPPDVQVKSDMPVRPCCEYGASKCYAEAVGRYFADQRGMSVIALRIGGVHGHETDNPHPDSGHMDILVSEQDLTQLITKCIEAPDDLRFDIFHGLSNNRFKRLDISHAREMLNYDPEDTVGEDENVPEPLPIHPS